MQTRLLDVANPFQTYSKHGHDFAKSGRSSATTYDAGTGCRLLRVQYGIAKSSDAARFWSQDQRLLTGGDRTREFEYRKMRENPKS
jgi:hypothetical protein